MAQVSGGGGSAGSYVPEGDRTAAMGSGGRFRIEPSEVRRLADGIDAAIGELDVVLAAISRVAQVNPPGTDPFSASAVEVFGQTADGGAGALMASHNAFKQVLEDTKAQLLRDANAAEAQDGSTATSLGQGI